MTRFHASVRDMLEDMYIFLANTLQKDSLSSTSIMHKDKLLVQLSNMQKDYPELQLKFPSNSLGDQNPSDISEISHYCPSSPVPYVDMNGGSLCKFPAFSQSILPEDSSYDVCLIKEKYESRSIAESDDYLSDDAKNQPYVAASELASCDKAGYLDKKKRESIKGWLNPFKRRWCAIKDGVLYYYEKTSDRKQRGSISLAGYEARALLEDNNEARKYNHCFELVCPGKRTYQFSASSERDLQQWIAVVEKNNNIKYSGKYGQTQSNLISNSSTNFETDYADNIEDIYETVLEEEEDPQLSEYKMQESPLDNEEYSDVDNVSAQNQIFNYSEWYVGLWDCTSGDDNELSFMRGDLIRITSKEFDSYAWWIGELDGKIGFVPKSYLMEAYESY